MGRISRKTIDEVLQVAAIEEVIGDYVRLKRRGSNYVALCPFHNEKTPSFVVSPSKGIYKCFGCGRAGGVIQFLMEHEQLSFSEAIRLLAKRYGIAVEEEGGTTDEESQRAQDERERLYLLFQAARDYYVRQLDTDMGKSVVLPYLRQRGIRKDTFEAFGLGYAGDDPKGLTNHLLSMGYPKDILRQAGLMTQSGKDFFRNRLIFPLHNPSGRVIGFAGRTLSDAAKGPKYINTPESPIYRKSAFLYGLDRARRSIRQREHCIVVEGYMDVLILHQYGLTHVVAASGTAITEEHARLLKRHTDRVVLMLDADDAGIRAALRAIDILLSQNLHPQVVLLPEGEDPDSYLRNLGIEAFEHYIQTHTEDFLPFKARILLKGAANNPLKKSNALKEVVQSLAYVSDIVRRHVYIQECARIFDMEESIIVHTLNGILRRMAKRAHLQRIGDDDEVVQESPPTAVPQPFDTQTDYYKERALVEVLMRYGHIPYDEENGISIYDFILKNIRDIRDKLETPLFQKIIDEAYQMSDSSTPPTLDYYLQHSDEAIRNLAIELSVSPYEYSPNWETKYMIYSEQAKRGDALYREIARKAVLNLKLAKINRMLADNQREIEQLEQQGHQIDILRTKIAVHERLIALRKQIADELGIVVS